MHINHIGRGYQWDPTQAARRAAPEEQAVKDTAAAPAQPRVTETPQAEEAFARDLEVRTRLGDAEEVERTHRHEHTHRGDNGLEKEFKQLGKELGRAVMQEARDQGLSPDQMKELRSIVKDFRFAVKEAMWHDHGHRDGHDQERSALDVVEAFASALEQFAADLTAFAGVEPVEEPAVVEPPVVAVDPPSDTEVPNIVKPDPVEIAATA